MAGLTYSRERGMGGAQVCVHPSPCAEDGYLPGDAMNKQYFAVWKLNCHFLTLLLSLRGPSVSARLIIDLLSFHCH